MSILFCRLPLRPTSCHSVQTPKFPERPAGTSSAAHWVFFRGIIDVLNRSNWVGNCARLLSTIQAGGGATELARRCRGALLAALVPGQDGGSYRLCVGHWLDAEPSTDISITLSLEWRGRLVRSIRCPAPPRQGEAFNFSRQKITHTLLSSRFGWSQTASRLRERMRWSIAPADELVGVWVPEAPSGRPPESDQAGRTRLSCPT